MSTTSTTDFQPVGVGRRIVNVVKLNLVNPWTTIILPLIILGSVFTVNLLLWWIVLNLVRSEAHSSVEPGSQSPGITVVDGQSWVFIYMMVVAIQAVNLTFPFALGYGVTRRDFWLGTSVTFVLLSAMYAIGLTILSVIEEVTDGWGFGGRILSAFYFGEGPGQHLFIFFVAFLFFFFFGAAIAAVYARWKATGVTLFFAALGVILITVAAILTVTASWQMVGDFFVGAGVLGSFAWSLVITLIAGTSGYLILRRATPRN